MASPDRLNERQRLFAQRWAEHGVASRAAIEAGYGEKNAARTASRLSENVHVLDIVRQLHAERATAARETLVVNEEQVLRGLLTLALNTDNETPHTVRRQAWKDLGTHLGMFVQRHEIDPAGLERAADRLAEEYGLAGQEGALVARAEEILREARTRGGS